MTADPTLREGIIYLRLSDFRDEDDGMTWEARADELREFAAANGVNVAAANVRIENDLNGASRTKGASGYLETLKVVTAEGLITFRTNRPVFHGVALDLQNDVAQVLIVSSDSRAARNGRDGRDLVDAARVSGCQVWAPDDDDQVDVLLDGRDRDKINQFRDRINAARQHSAAISRAVRKGRKRWAGKSYQGGRRPFGYRPDPDAPEHRKRLIKVPAEAQVIEDAAEAILGKHISLKAVARDLREREPARRVPTVTGAPWSAETLRCLLIKPAVAGLTPKGRPPARGQPDERLLVDAPWEPILDDATWRRLRALLTDPSRRTNTSRANEPRWLLSGFATCGVCGGRTRVLGGRDRAPAYTGTGCAHVRRNAAALDRYIAGAVIEVLSRPDAADLLRPPPRPEVDTGKLHAGRRDLEKRREAQIALHREGAMTDAELAKSLRGFRAQLDAISAQLAASSHPDPLPEFRPENRQGRTAAQVWDALAMPRRRAVVQTILGAVEINRTGSRGRHYDIDQTVTVTPHPQTLG